MKPRSPSKGLPQEDICVTEGQRRSLLRAATKVARRRGWKAILDDTWKDTADPDEGKHIGRRVRFESGSPDAQAAKVQRMRRNARFLKGLPPNPTPEELAIEAEQREAHAAKRAEHEAKVAKVKAALGEELSAELERRQTTLAAAQRTIEQTKIEMQAVLMRGRGLNNIAATVLQEADGDVDKALEIIADRMIDEEVS